MRYISKLQKWLPTTINTKVFCFLSSYHKMEELEWYPVELWPLALLNLSVYAT